MFYIYVYIYIKHIWTLLFKRNTKNKIMILRVYTNVGWYFSEIWRHSNWMWMSKIFSFFKLCIKYSWTTQGLYFISFIINRFELASHYISYRKFISLPNSTPGPFPSYFHLYFIFFFYFTWCTLQDFPSVSSLVSLPFISCCHRTKTTTTLAWYKLEWNLYQFS